MENKADMMFSAGVCKEHSGSMKDRCGLKLVSTAICILLLSVCLAGCGGKGSNSAVTGGTMGESAEDKTVNLNSLVAQNPDIFGWLYIPDTGIDYPLLQNMDGDDEFYKTHDCTGRDSVNGALYIEAGNLLDMCDFNTVVNGYSGKGGCFEALRSFGDKGYFDKHGQFYIVIDGNALTYEIWAAYERDDVSIIRSYDLTEEEGCKKYLEDMRREMPKNALIREGWEEGPAFDNFLVTLTARDPEHPGKQFIVQGCLIDDQAGTIER